MTEAKVWKPASIFAPLPSTERGYSVQLCGDKTKNRIAYCNDRYVIIRSLESPESIIFSKHLHKAKAATISPCGNWVASGDETGQVYVWGINRPDAKPKNEVKACGKVNAICWSFDSKRVCAVGDGNPNRGKVFPYDSGNSVGQVNGHTEKIIACDWSGKRPFRLVTSGEDLCIAVYKNIPVKYDSQFDGEDHKKYCNAIKFSPDSSVFATAGADSKIFIYDGKEPDEPIKKMGGMKKGHKGSAIYSLVWSADGKMIATGSADRTVKVWTVEDKKVIKTFTAGTKGHEFFQVGVLWLKDQLLSVSLDGSFTFWDFENEKALKRWCGHKDKMTGLAVSNGVIHSSCLDTKLCKWDLETCVGTWYEGSAHSEKGINALKSTIGGKLATIGNDKTLLLTEAKGTEWSKANIALTSHPYNLATGQKTEVVAVLMNGAIQLVTDGKITDTVKVSYKPCAGGFSADDTTLCVGDPKGKLFFFNVEGGKLTESDFKSSGTHTGEIRGIAYSKDGRLLITADAQKKIRVVSTVDGKTLNKFAWEYHQAAVTDIAFSPDGKTLATCSMDEGIIIWKDLETFSASKRVEIPCTHVGGVLFVDWLDDNTLVTAGYDRSIKTWKV